MSRVKLRRFHIDVFYPEWSNDSILAFVEEVSKKQLILSYHAATKYRKLSRQYKRMVMDLMENVNLKESINYIFEFYSDDRNQVKKACFRFPSNDEELSDIILVISSTGKIVTIFLNKNFDPRISLDRNLYEQERIVENVI
jgi:hypothetical protein